MKKHLYFLIFLFFSVISSFGQASSLNQKEKLKVSKEYENSIELSQTGLDELNVNILSPIWGNAEINYEHILNTNSGIGISGNLNTGNHYYQTNHLLAFYRLYFGKKLADGFFIESSIGYSSIKDDFFCCTYKNPKDYRQVNGLGLGIAIGYKKLIKNGVVCQLFAGIGRNFDTVKDTDSYRNGYPFPRAGITLGKRFGK